MQIESAILLMTDVHYGKKTVTYDPGVFKRRMYALTDKMARIRELLTGQYTIDKLYVLNHGDLNDGTDIFAGQDKEQAEPNVEAQASDVATFLDLWLRQQADVWGRVEYHAVAGNHGRAGKSASKAANWDIVANRYLTLRVGNVVPCFFPTGFENVFLHKVVIRGHTYLMFHGHTIKMYQTIPWYGIMQRALRWSTTRALAPFDVLTLGHFHTVGSQEINNVSAMMSGTMVDNDEWALTELGLQSQTKWWLFGVSDHYTITWQYRLDLC